MAMKRRALFAVIKTSFSPVISISDRAHCKCTVCHTKCTSLSYSTAQASQRKPAALVLRVFGVSVFGASVYAFLANVPTVHAEAPHDSNKDAHSRKIRLEDVKKHGANAEAKWVTKGTRVYDITDWISIHPGGEVILQSAGGAVDPYWDIFTIHKKQAVYDILEGYYVGDIDPQDLVNGQMPEKNVENPFERDPKRDEKLIAIAERPYSSETPAEELRTFVTPNETFYVRNHFWVPKLDESSHRLVVELYDGDEKVYTMKDLKENFEQVKITATLQCAGNRRKHMNESARSTNGLPWTVGGISNAQWTGVRLRDVLADAGFPVDNAPSEVQHAQFMAAEAYGASIPINKAIDKQGDVLLAYEMNGKPLPPDHGYPIRVLVPGNVAARSVKWVNKIVLSDEESTAQWQRRDYRLFGPNVSSESADWESAPSIQEMPVQSAITSLRNISTHSKRGRQLLQMYGVEEDSLVVEGYCYSGGGRRVVRVDVSANGGDTWCQAELLPDEAKGAKAWAWKRWRWVLPRREAGRCFVVKAIDESYNTQPNEYEPTYNFRGNLTSSWHRVPYRPGDDTTDGGKKKEEDSFPVFKK